MTRRQVNIRLPEAAADKLAEMARAKGISQSELIARLLDRVQVPTHPSLTSRDQTEPAVAHPAGANVVQLPVSACVHRETMIVGGGIKRCRQCGATQGMDRVWR